MVNDEYIREKTSNFKELPNIPPTETDGIKVTIRLPDRIPEAVKQRKINRIYDILKPDVPC